MGRAWWAGAGGQGLVGRAWWAGVRESCVEGRAGQVEYQSWISVLCYCMHDLHDKDIVPELFPLHNA